MWTRLLLPALLLAAVAVVTQSARKPNIIFLLADDLGWNDVSWHNKEMLTPNMEQLARDGILLEQAYSQQVCTPSRAALLTGRYPFHIGRQKRALKPLQPSGLMTNLTTLPGELRKLGYRTHMVGKWHLGYCAWDYTPNRRGFDTFLGFYLGSENHFSHDRDYKSHPSDPPSFYDFRHNEEVAEEGYAGKYSTVVFRERSIDIINRVADERDLNAYGNYKPFFLYLSMQAPHAPLQARSEILAKIPQSTNPARDIYKAMVYDVDLALGDIVQTLREQKLYNDTIIVVTSDNGGAISHGASNFPLRGTKGTLFEGGTRAPTFVHGPKHLLDRRGVVSRRLVHITDWMPTLLRLAGHPDPGELGLDGVDQVAALARDQEVRQEMVYNLKVNPISGAYRYGPYKIIFGKKFNKQGWYDTDNTALQCSRMMKNKKLKRKEERDSRKIELNTSRQIAKTLKTKKSKNSTKRKKVTKRRKINKKKESKRKQLQRKRERQRIVKKKQRQRERQKKVREKKKRRRKEKKQSREEKNLSRQVRKQKKKGEKIEKKITKLWRDWLPAPSVEIQNMLRLRMDDCNWKDFSDSGHSEDLQLIPRAAFQFGDIAQIIDPMLNPFNISSADEDSEFDIDDRADLSEDEKLEKKFSQLDIAMYNILEDPEERNDLKYDLPDIFEDLKRRTLIHLKNVVPEDFPSQDFSGHPRNFDNYFSPGWCTASPSPN